MSVRINTTVIGLDELEKAAKELTEEIHSRGGRKQNLVRMALNTVAKDVELRMVKAAPISAEDQGSHIDWHKSRNGKWVHGGPKGNRDKPGRLRRSIFRKPGGRALQFTEVVHVGPRMGSSRNDPEGAWYAAIVEMHGGAGGVGKGFMRNAIIPAHHSAMFGNELGRHVERVAKRIGNANAQAIGAKYKK